MQLVSQMLIRKWNGAKIVLETCDKCITCCLSWKVNTCLQSIESWGKGVFYMEKPSIVELAKNKPWSERQISPISQNMRQIYLHLLYQAWFTEVHVLTWVECLQRFHQRWNIHVVIIIKMTEPPDGQENIIICTHKKWLSTTFPYKAAYVPKGSRNANVVGDYCNSMSSRHSLKNLSQASANQM